MSCRDRTHEFLSACKSLQGRQDGAQPGRAAPGAGRQRSEFSLMAKRIGKDLSNTFAKLEKLTILAKRKSLFDDKAVEIEELTYIIKQDINSLNKQIAQLQEVVRARGGQSGRHVQTHSNTVVVSLQSKLASMSNDFKSVLEVRTENLKQQRSRREHFSRAPVSALPLAAGNMGSSAVLQDEPQRAGSVAIEMDTRTSQQLQLIDEQDSYIQSRADTMQNIESTIVELGSIFQQLAHMVKEQEETIQRIDASVEDAQLNVEAAHGEILKYFQSALRRPISSAPLLPPLPPPMVLPGPPGMSRSEEVHRLTENVYKTIMEQFNPSLRNFISMGKTYEKALASMTYAAKGYFDALVKMGELASESQGSKELGDVLFQMAEVHRQIQNQLEEMLKSFHNELLTQLEQKVELDSRYLSAALKKYQTEQRSKGDSLDKCQAELKKLRKKSQGSKNPQKYSDKELQYIEAISNKQGELENYVSDGYKTALTEERRRFCFLVEKQCAVAKSAITYHAKGKEMLTQKLPLWQQSCSDPNKIPDRAIQLMQQMAASSNGTIMPSPLSTSKSNLIISDPIPGAKPLPVPPELAPFVGRMSAQEAMPVMNGVSGPDSDGYNHWSEMKPAQPKSLSPPQPQKQLSDSYSNTLPVRKNVPPKNSYASAENKTLPRSSSMAAGLERNGRTRVQAIFSHAAGDNSTLLSFKEGDLITLLVPEARDGWHYGESEKTKLRGWFPFSYTRVLDNDGSERVHTSLQQGKSSSTGNLLDKDDIAIPPPDYGMASQAFPAQGANTFKQRPYSVAVPAFSQGLDDYGTRSVSSPDVEVARF